MAKRASTIDLTDSLSLPGHGAECICVGCCMLDMDNHIVATLGEDALARINRVTGHDRSVMAEKKFGKAPGTRSGRGIVRGMSEAQKRYATFLINTRDTSHMRLLNGWTLDITKLDTISLRHASAFIDALKNCPEKTLSHSSKKEISGSQKQIDWITNTLLKERGITTEADIKSVYIECNYSASKIITKLLGMPKVDNTPKVELSEGMYKVDERIFKVYFNQAGTRLLAKELIDGSFEYQGMANRFVKAENRMTLAEAKAYGKVTGTCCVCSRRLTDEDSIAEGIGPVCAGKF